MCSLCVPRLAAPPYTLVFSPRANTRDLARPHAQFNRGFNLSLYRNIMIIATAENGSCLRDELKKNTTLYRVLKMRWLIVLTFAIKRWVRQPEYHYLSFWRIIWRDYDSQNTHGPDSSLQAISGCQISPVAMGRTSENWTNIHPPAIRAPQPLQFKSVMSALFHHVWTAEWRSQPSYCMTQ